MSEANAVQVGGSHYKTTDEEQGVAELLGYEKPVEHWDFVVIRGYNYLQGNASKYLDRYDKKGTPIQDLKKAQHYIQKLIEIEEAKVAAEEAAQVASKSTRAGRPPVPPKRLH